MILMVDVYCKLFVVIDFFATISCIVADIFYQYELSVANPGLK